MEFIRTIREKRQTQRHAQIEKMAEDVIKVKDFAGSLYIAYNGTPFVPINPDWTTKEIIQELSILRSNFINAKMKENGLGLAAAF